MQARAGACCHSVIQSFSVISVKVDPVFWALYVDLVTCTLLQMDRLLERFQLFSGFQFTKYSAFPNIFHNLSCSETAAKMPSEWSGHPLSSADYKTHIFRVIFAKLSLPAPVVICLQGMASLNLHDTFA